MCVRGFTRPHGDCMMCNNCGVRSLPLRVWCRMMICTPCYERLLPEVCGELPQWRYSLAAFVMRVKGCVRSFPRKRPRPEGVWDSVG